MMRYMGRRAGWGVIGVLLASVILTACGSDHDERTVTQGSELFSVTFDDEAGWETGTAADSTLAISDGRYQIDHRSVDNASFAWGIGPVSGENVIVDVTIEQLSADDDNLFGVVCRLGTDRRENATGYALLISGDGHFGIAELRSNSLSFLLKWHQTDAIHQGQATNTLRAVCVDDYLALYANGKFLGSVTDSMYQTAGSIGLLAGANAGLTVSVAFDDLTGYEAILGE